MVNDQSQIHYSCEERMLYNVYMEKKRGVALTLVIAYLLLSSLFQLCELLLDLFHISATMLQYLYMVSFIALRLFEYISYIITAVLLWKWNRLGIRLYILTTLVILLYLWIWMPKKNATFAVMFIAAILLFLLMYTPILLKRKLFK